MRAPILLAAAAAIAAAAPARAQGMQGMDHSMMPGMKMPAAPRAKPAPRKATRSPAAVKRARKGNAAPVPDVKASPAPGPGAMDHGSMPGMAMPGGKETNAETPGTEDAMPGMDMSGGSMPGMTMTGTALPASDAPAPSPPTDHYAARIYPAAEIEQSHRQMMRESGAQTLAFAMFNLAEYQPRRGRDGFRWDGEGWYGGDINRLTIKTEGEGRFGEGVDTAEVQALYSRAIDPYFNAQVGVRQDLGRGARRTYATIGVEGLAPYWFEVEAALFLSDKGDVLGRLEGYYDQRITQRLILQPRVELNLSAQDMPASRIGAGLSNAEVGLRLRYEITRQFAPYFGVSWDRKTGQTARYARADGEDVESKGLVAGIRFWF